MMQRTMYCTCTESGQNQSNFVVELLLHSLPARQPITHTSHLFIHECIYADALSQTNEQTHTLLIPFMFLNFQNICAYIIRMFFVCNAHR